MRSILLGTAVLTLVLVGCNEDNTNKNTPAGGHSSTTPASSTTTANSRPLGTDHPVAADNTGRNARDDGSTVTPVDQGNSETDIAITREIRQAVVANKGISVKGHNVKIITKDAVVTLRGPVESESERTTITGIAEKVPNVKTVINHLEIAAP